MQKFSGMDYLRISIANHFGHDKVNWIDRLLWFYFNEGQLDDLIEEAEEPVQMYAAVKAYRAAQQGHTSGYTVSLDATASGMQILAVMARDVEAMNICNVLPTDRKDGYTEVYKAMQERLSSAVTVERDTVKGAVMKALYGSSAAPKEAFGEGEVLDVFYDVVETLMPKAWALNHLYLAMWDPTATEYRWILPDNFHVVDKVMDKEKFTFHFGGMEYTSYREVNKARKKGRSIGANVTHSVDGLIVREIVARCSYEPDVVESVKRILASNRQYPIVWTENAKMVKTLWENYEKSGFLSARILNYLDINTLQLTDKNKIQNLVDSLPKIPFDVLTIHDCFRVLPNYGDDLRQQYANLLAEIYESNLLNYILAQFNKELHIDLDPVDAKVAEEIRTGEYAIC